MLASEPPLHTYCGTCMEIRFVAPSLFRGFEQRLGILVISIQQFPLRPSYVPRRKERRLPHFPRRLATCCVSEDEEAMAET
jgi:hypothetical protein